MSETANLKKVCNGPRRYMCVCGGGGGGGELVEKYKVLALVILVGRTDLINGQKMIAAFSNSFHVPFWHR